MKCPYCNYVDTNVNFQSNPDYAEFGDIFRISNNIKMKRDSDSYEKPYDEKEIYGCPKCKKIFMDY